MKKLLVSFLGITFLLIFGLSLSGFAADTLSLPVNNKLSSVTSFKEGEVLVKFKEDRIDVSNFLGKTSLKIFEITKGITEVELLERQNIALMTSKIGETTAQLVQRLRNDPRIEFVEPNYKRTLTATPNDSHFLNLWGLNNTGQIVNGSAGTKDADIDALQAWDISTGGSNTIVAIIDTGAQVDHPDLVNNMWNGSLGCFDDSNNIIPGGCPNHGWDFFNSDNNPVDDHGHGTHVAGTIGAKGNNALGVTGVNWTTQIMAIKAGNQDGFFISDWVKGLNFAKNNGAKIVNISFGGTQFSQTEANAIASFGGLFIAAAGNNASNNEVSHVYPSDYDLPNIISVAATNQNDVLASFSNYGTTSVDVAAPGTNILSTYLGGIYAFSSGTSMATPHVTGEAAMIWNYNPSLTPSLVKSVILTTGDAKGTLSGKVATGKRINLYNALNIFNPVGGFDRENVIPVLQISQSASGDGVMTIHFRVKDGMAGFPITLKNFEYSIDGGAIFQAPTNGDLSGALSANWNNNNYTSSSDFTGAIYSFALNTKHADLSGFADTDQNDVIVRFKVNDGAKDSPSVTTAQFRVNQVAPTATLSNTPGKPVNGRTADIVVGGTNVVSYQFSLDGGGMSADTPLATHIQMSNLTDGEHTLTVIGKDSQENIQTIPTTFTWTVDATTPDITGLSNDPTVARSKTWNWDSTHIDATFRFSIDLVADGTPTGDYSATKTATQANGDGTFYLHVQAKNNLGNESGVTTVSVVLDNTPPTAILTQAPAISTTSTSASITVGGTGVTHYKYSLNDQPLSAETPVETPITLSSLSLGSQVVKVIGRDLVGNYQDISVATQVTWTIVYESNITGLSNDLTVARSKTWNWDSPDSEATFRFSIDQVADGIPTGAYSVTKTATQANGDGTFYLHVQSKNTQGNESEVITISVVLDNTAPIALLTGIPPGITTSTLATITVGGTAVAHYKYSLNDQPLSEEIPVSTILSLSSLSLGTQILKVIGSDLLGNYQDISVATQATWTIVSVPITPPSSGGGGGGGGGGGSPAPAPVPIPIPEPLPTTLQNAAPTTDYVGHWAEEYITTLFDGNIVSGCGDNNYCPDTNITRAELLKIVMNLFSLALRTGEATDLRDIEGHWAYDFIVTAQQTGIIAGYADKTFRPDLAINRAEAMKILFMGANIATTSEGIVNPFADVKESDWHYDFVMTAFKNNIVEGYIIDGVKVFKPGQSITRAEFAKMAVLVKSLVQ